MAQIPKGRLLETPYKVCKDCAMFFSITVLTFMDTLVAAAIGLRHMDWIERESSMDSWSLGEAESS